MDIQSIVDQVTHAAQNDSSVAEKLSSDPANVISSITGHDLDAGSLQEVLSNIAQGDNGIDLGDIAGDLLSGNADGILGDVQKAIGDNIADAAGDLLGGLFGKK